MKTKSHHSDTRQETQASDIRSGPAARQWLDYQGLSVAKWARDHGFSASLVRQILAGRKQCRHGQSHNIAVALGMKNGVPAAPTSRTRAEKQGAAA